MRIGVISNPRSQKNRRDPDRARRLQALLGDNDTLVLTRDGDALNLAAAQMRDAGVQVLALNGGDGTNHMTLTAFVNAYGDAPLPKVALLRGGTMNTISNSLGIKGSPERILGEVVAQLDLGANLRTSRRMLMRVTDRGTHRYGFMFGTGVVYNFLEEYYRAPEVSPAVAAATLARVLGSIAVRGKVARRLVRPFPGRVTADGELWQEGDFLAVLASTQEELGLGFRPFTRCLERPDAFQTITIQGSTLDVVRALPAIRLGRPLNHKGFDDRLVEALELDCDGPLEYMIDGELFSADEHLAVCAGPSIDVVLV